MTLWFKFEEAMRANGKVAEAGPDGALAYIALLCLHTAKGRNGVVPASCCKPSRLRAEAVAFLGSFDPERIEKAIQACVEAHLIERVNDDGTPCAQIGVPCALRLRGWCDEHAVACSHCRGPNPEPSHKTCPTCREKRAVDRQSTKHKGARRTRAHGAERAQSGVGGAQLAALDSDSDSDSGRERERESACARDPGTEQRPRPAESPLPEAAEAIRAELDRFGVLSLSTAQQRALAVELAADGEHPSNLADYAAEVGGDQQQRAARLCALLRDPERLRAINDRVARRKAGIA